MVCNNTKTSYQLQRSVQLLNASSKKKTDWIAVTTHLSIFFGLQKLQLKLLVPTMQEDQQSSNFSAHYQSHKNKQLPYKNIQ